MGAVKWVLAAAATVALLATAGPAAADEPADSDEARTLVLQGIALIVHRPHDMHAIEERIHHALEADNAEGVDLALVDQAHGALHAGQVGPTRELLQVSIGAGPFVGRGVPKPIREALGSPGRPAFAVGAETGTAVVLDEYRPASGLDGGNLALLILSATGIVLGTVLAWRFRPVDTVRGLRRAAAPGGAT